MQFIKRDRVLLLFIILIAVFFRFTGVNWDQGHHLHPDERFLTLVGTAMKIPGSLFDYLNPAKSSMNPANIGYPFFVYGLFPLTLTKLLAAFFNMDTYESFTILGRMLSGFIDVIGILALYGIVAHLEKEKHLTKKLKIFTVFLYAIAVLPIQLSHFLAVDTFLNAFLLLSFYAVLKKKTWVSSLFFGLAAASKITAVFFLPVLLFVLFQNSHSKRKLLQNFAVFGITSFIVLHLANPYMFISGNLLDPRPSTSFIGSLTQLKGFENSQALYPPSVQWIHKTPVLYSGFNLLIFGLGLPYGILAVFGLFLLLKKRSHTMLFLLAVWSLAMFFYQSVQFAKNKHIRLVILISVLIWPLAFLSIYFHPHTRVDASYWISEHVPSGSRILTEHWDDPLPLSVSSSKPKTVIITELSVFDPDNAQKWEKMSELLKKGDYYILSSNRGWGSIPTVPERYPHMKVFYEKLLSDQTDYKLLKTFTSYPSFKYLGLPFEFPDHMADESFTVYDHPVVMIFKHIK